MSPETNPNEVQTPEQDAPEAAVPASEGGKIQLSNPEATDDRFEEVKAQVLSILSDLFDYVGKFFSEYKKPLINVGLVVGALVAIYLVASIVDAINDIPLLSPLFELVGIGYSGWFIFRYLLTAEARTELQSKITDFSQKVTGTKS
ncbi:CAAD domain-containing protein [Baaleninema sp.]|uniref:CAAD domain-containing protein n=1 Tax=Baaleninema sp. TaxID=3101197 RepID=UPI003CFF293F